jgi:hypothetical protein
MTDTIEVERIMTKLVDALEGYELFTGALAIAGQMTPDAWVELDKLHHKACSALNQAKGA